LNVQIEPESDLVGQLSDNCNICRVIQLSIICVVFGPLVPISWLILVPPVFLISIPAAYAIGWFPALIFSLFCSYDVFTIRKIRYSTGFIAIIFSAIYVTISLILRENYPDNNIDNYFTSIKKIKQLFNIFIDCLIICLFSAWFSMFLARKFGVIKSLFVEKNRNLQDKK
jgi:hypothetical protein